ncbi:MAG: hypothetical protein K0B14_00985 [Anaerolineaceae bacterium]|nr:hypothetical protein [Anaerolineaceae bacterium]
MQKILRILIIIFLFMMCLLIGAKLANVSLSGDENIVINNDMQEQNQIRFLVFIVDELNEKNPELKSVWSVIIYDQDSSGFMFLPLTDVNAGGFKDIKRSFILTTEKDPHEKTIKFFNTKFKTKWDAHIVLDRYAVEYLLNWITRDSLDVNSMVEVSQPVLIQNMCTSIISRELNPIETLEWTLINPDHFKTNLQFDRIVERWQNLRISNTILCEIISE